MTIPDDTQGRQRRRIAEAWLADLDAALVGHDHGAAAALFTPDCYWRDLLALTWDIRTFHGQGEVEAALGAAHEPSGFTDPVLEDGDPVEGVIGDRTGVVEAFFGFRTAMGRGRGFVRLVEDGTGAVRAFTFLTTLQELEGYPEKTGIHRRRDNRRAVDGDRENWLDRRIATAEFATEDPEVLVIGAGQAGITLAARLGQLGVSTLVVDRMERIGDNWRNRYHSLTLHNEICVNHMPYLPFPDTWPIYIPKDMLADWFESYAKALELNVWTGVEFLDGHFDEGDRRWTVRLRRPDGTIRTLRPSHLAMATGVSGIPNVTSFEGMEDFQGQVVHSSGRTEDLDVEGRTALVVGAGNSAHDIAQDLCLRGADVTMLQRSSTTVVSLEPSAARVFTLYSQAEGVRPLEDTDLRSASVPNALLHELHGPLSKVMAEDDKELLDGLRAAGFALDNGEDDTGFYLKLIRYFGGYYINVGASDLIIEGRIKLKQGKGIEHFTTDGVVLADGSPVKADLVVLATGFKPMQEGVRALLGDEVADRVGPIWGPGPDWEQRGMWSRTGQDNFYVLGGSFAMCRIYSRYVALQIKAAVEGIAPPRWSTTEVGSAR
ncbi:NAD(P)/FAD-dependent oxidoreductase [Umezawaea sp. Da 62-37]|uniref:flavin-containing monooxygenase n=1 Tax=Umezawaea sp. Da 62-37 TaxID=3075927 RepID=UPI0028F7120F|nr:NAD(P)/FAD-dependent oxidoreductase [Umezawaea sp. Da 62-37]WNV88240.1 NAD(P)/FAD-dependent oxidoreductase [Umezawaea sp. Da 62-37]